MFMNLHPMEVEEYFKRVGAQGAASVLEQAGLTGPDAGKDLEELRNMLDGWRSMKRSIVSGAANLFGKVLIFALLLGIYISLKTFKLSDIFKWDNL